MASGLELSEVVKKLDLKSITVEVFEQWEKEGGNIGLSTLRSLGKFYKRPLAYFFLSHPIEAEIIPADFRTLPQEANPGKLRPETMLAIRRARRSQNMFLDFQVFANTERAPLPAFTLSDNPKAAAAHVRLLMGIKEGHTFAFDGDIGGKFLKFWIKQIENFGILVQQDASEKINDGGVRGFCLKGDGHKPSVIYLNSTDSVTGRVFTLLHEFYHLMLDANGVKLEENRVSYKAEIGSIEKKCNDFAGNFLVPENELLPVLQSLGEEVLNVEDVSDYVLKKAAKRFGVSKYVIIRRMLELGLVSHALYQKKTHEWDEVMRLLLERRKATAKNTGGKQWDVTYFEQNGGLLTRVLYEAYNKGAISDLDLSQKLQFKTRYIDKIEDLLNKHSHA